MIVYHIDRFGTLEENQEIRPFTLPKIDSYISSQYPNTSMHGNFYIRDNVFNSQEFLSCFLWENILEQVRVKSFPQYPSRFSCLFGCKTQEDTKKWVKYFKKDFPHPHIVEIETENCYEFDSSWITDSRHMSDIKHMTEFQEFSLLYYTHFANQYWSGQKSKKPLMEVLIPVPCKTKNITIK